MSQLLHDDDKDDAMATAIPRFFSENSRANNKRVVDLHGTIRSKLKHNSRNCLVHLSLEL